jgi:hypothetical protein
VVVRGAYTVSSFQEGTGTNLRLTLNPPFFNEFETINEPTVLGSTLSAGFDALRAKDPLVGTVLRAWDPQMRPARSQQWNLTTDRQIHANLSVSVGYVGQHGTHLVVPVNANQRVAPNGPRPLDAVFPQIASVILTTPNADQTYHAMQATARRRSSTGLDAWVSYTWSRAWSHGRGFFSDGGQAAEQPAFWPNPGNRDADWGPVPFDVRHNLAVAGLYDVPLGRGRRWLASSSGWVNAVAGGWSIAGIWKAHTGFPVTVNAPDQSQTGARSGRPDRTRAGTDPREVGPDRFWFDTSVFTLPRLGTFGNAGVGIVRGPGLNVVDSSIAKRIGTSRRLEVRADVFNLFNTPAFDAPDRSLTSPTFGRVLSAQLAREIQLSLKLLF